MSILTWCVLHIFSVFFSLTCAVAWKTLAIFCIVLFFFFFKQKTAYEMRISDWSSDVCSSDLDLEAGLADGSRLLALHGRCGPLGAGVSLWFADRSEPARREAALKADLRSEEHTSELQSLMRISYAVFCLKKKRKLTERILLSLTHT